MNTQGKVKLQVWLLIVVVFALGAVTGGSLDRVYLARSGALRTDSPNHTRGPNRMIERLKSDLSLNDDQVAKIKTIFDESRKEFPPSRFAECPGFKESRAKTRQLIRETLTSDQQKRFDEINARRDSETNKDH
jgi:Spy/CpxP family protein refolding chaperone